ncbi:MAG: YdeI/OmpD-associated family protein [Rhizobium sp.]|nr:YdeI/OmpD-associated family protein [Rhizobium sp.]
MSEMQHRLDGFFAGQDRWQAELLALRQILLRCGLLEEFKWSSPCYTVDGANVAILWGFKDNATLGFFKGVLLKDEQNLLRAPGENSRSSRVLRFVDLDEISKMEPVIRAYVLEAMELEKAGTTVDLVKDDIVYPEELIAAMEADPPLQEAFEALTPGRRRGYALFFGQPKHAATREGRIQKMRDRILAGKGLHDR